MTETLYDYVIKFEEDDPTVVRDARTPRALAEAFAAARATAFGAKGRTDTAVFVTDGGAFLISAIKSISLCGPVEQALLGEQNSKSQLRLAQALAIQKGVIQPDEVGKDGEVIPANELEDDEELDDEEYEEEGEGQGALPAPAVAAGTSKGLAGLAGG